jgi:hypothetical protein
MLRRRGLLLGVSGPLVLCLYREMFVLDDPPVDAVLHHPLSELTLLTSDWAGRIPAPQDPALTVAFLRLSTACHDFAQGVALHLNAMQDDIPAAQRGLDRLVRALRHALALAKRHDPAWRATISDAALDAPSIEPWIAKVEVMEGMFALFIRFASRFEWAARRLAAEAA